MSRATAKKLIDFLYVNNPFYLISAGLFVYGLKLLLRPGTSPILFQQGSVGYIEPWGLLAALAGITALMTFTAILIVRLGQVWEDARSLTLIILLMLFAMTVSTDELVNQLADESDSLQPLALLFGLMIGFSIGTVETVLQGLKLRLPATYRLPLHLLLSLMIAWPILLVPEISEVTVNQIQQRIAIFPVACGIMILSLLAAVWQGSSRARTSSCPWTWPLYPWTAFLFLLLAVCLRTYSLTMSFDVLSSSGHYWDTSFGLWQLTPIFIATLVILMEIGIRENQRKLQSFCLLAAPVLLVIACPWIVPWSNFSGFRSATLAMLADHPSPVYCTLITLILFYARARHKRVAGAHWGLLSMVLLSTVIQPESFHQSQFITIQHNWNSWPLIAFAAIECAVGIRQKAAGKIFLSSAILTLIMHQQLNAVPAHSEWAFLAPWATAICWHLLLTIGMLIAIVDKSEFAEILKEIAVPALLLIVIATSVCTVRETGITQTVAYILFMTTVLLAIGRLTDWPAIRMLARFMASVCGTALLAWGLRLAYQLPLPKGSQQIILGLMSFGIAVAISLWKAGLGRRILLHRRRKQRRLRVGKPSTS
ncbi:MAG: hypothetical protein ABJZ55_09110 [Fuerstiella sp.]